MQIDENYSNVDIPLVKLLRKYANCCEDAKENESFGAIKSQTVWVHSPLKNFYL